MDLKTPIDCFSRFYTSTEKNKKLHWIFNQGSCFLRINRKKGQAIRLESTIFQSCILMLFNEKEVWEYKEIVDVLKLPEENIQESIQKLIMGKFHILTSEPEASKLKMDMKPEKLSINKYIESKQWPLKLSIRTETMAAVEKETLQSRQEVNEDRKIHVDASIVRVMKSRRKLEFQELISESINQLSVYFQPDISFLKKRIEVLLEDGYIRRDDENSSIFHYIS